MRRAAWALALVCAFFHAPDLAAQRRADLVAPLPAPHFAAREDAAPPRPELTARAASSRSVLGNAALITAGLGTMYLAYDVGEEEGGGFGTYIGVIGAVAFWAGVIRLATQ